MIKRSGLSRNCFYCGSENTIRNGKRWNKYHTRFNQKHYCKTCGKKFTSKRGLRNKVFKTRHSEKTFKIFREAVERKTREGSKITARMISNEMLKGKKRKKISFVTINRWLRICYPEIKRPTRKRKL